MKSITPQYQSALGVVKTLRQAGYQAFFVGGAVRDWLLGLEPKDYDVATPARPETVLGLFEHCLPIGVSFGVVLVLDGDVQTEVATFRSDGRYLDHRHPARVHFSTAREDAQRRDFTVNGLFYDPIEERVIDYVGGQADLKARRLRAIGSPGERFVEDALRLLRAVRFAARFDLTIEAETLRSIREQAPLLAKISAERVRDELVAILTGPNPADALRLMSDLDLLDVVLPEVAAMRGVAQSPEHHPEGDVFEHLLACFRSLEAPPSPALAFGLLLHDAGKPPTCEHTDRIRFNRHAAVGAEMAGAVCRRLKFPNAERKRIVSLVRDHMRFINAPEMRRSTLRRFMAKEGFDEDLALHRADCLASHGNLANYELCLAVRDELAAKGEALKPPPLVTGRDLKALGLKPGPAYKTILGQIQDLQLEGKAPTRDAALEHLRRIVVESKAWDVPDHP